MLNHPLLVDLIGQKLNFLIPHLSLLLMIINIMSNFNPKNSLINFPPLKVDLIIIINLIVPLNLIINLIMMGC